MPAKKLRAMPKRSERDVQAEITRLLVTRGWLVLPLNREAAGKRGARHIGMKGCADLLAFGPPFFEDAGLAHQIIQMLPVWFIEVKAPKGKTSRALTIAQANFGALVTKYGAHYLRIDPKSARTGCEQVCDALGWTT